MARLRPPTGRAAVGAVLVTLSVAGVVVATRPDPAAASARWTVVTRDVPAGTSLTPADLGTVVADVPDGVPAVPGERAEELIGRVTRSGLTGLSLLRPDDVWGPEGPARPGTVEVPVVVDTGRLPGAGLEVGATVDVLATDPDGGGTVPVASGVVVLGVDRGEAAAIGGSDGVPVRLGVPAGSVVAVVDAGVRAELTVVLPAPGTGGGA